ncbi:hypothetical protein C8J57DRAFT_1092015 [Mycena rebaudengoi]|nr:hypothetical protein C8J57DRAFT_1092015 [Mycena rebaudengoi]
MPHERLPRNTKKLADGIPEWAAAARDQLRKGPGGADWEAVVAMWWKQEESQKFAGPVHSARGHPPKGRPKEVALWVKHVCKAGSVKVVDAYAFAVEWWVRWVGINPEWREWTQQGRLERSQQGRLERSGGGDWKQLDIGGPNGVLNILICLRWRDAVGEQEEPQGWLEAVVDVKWVCVVSGIGWAMSTR